MHLHAKNFAVFALAILIALTSVTMALARGQSRDVAGMMVLCTGTGPVAINVDAEGEPIGPVHVCPDCALSLFDAAVVTSSVPIMPVSEGRKIEDSNIAWAGQRAFLEWRARGPPTG